MVIVLPEMIEAAWARAAPGREAASQNEALRMFFDELARLDRAPRGVVEFHDGGREVHFAEPGRLDPHER